MKWAKNIFALNNYIFSSEPLENGYFSYSSFLFRLISLLLSCCQCWSMFWHFVYSIENLCTTNHFLSLVDVYTQKQDTDFSERMHGDEEERRKKKLHQNEYRMYGSVCVHIFFKREITPEHTYR